MSVNDNIFRILKEKKMTQKELSMLSGVSESTISDWKKKGKVPGTDNLMHISKALKVGMEELLSDGCFKEDKALADYFLDEEEKSLIELYRRSEEKQKKIILKYVENLSK